MADDDLSKVFSRASRDDDHFAKGPEIVLHPLAGWTTGTLPQNNVMLAIEYLTDQPTIAARMLRLAMTRTQCAELASSLDRLARAPHVLPPDKPS